MKTLAIILPDGVTLRNFIYTSFLQEASEKFNLVIFHFVDSLVFDQLEPQLKNRIKFYKIDSYREAILAKIYRYAKQRASLLINNEEDPNPTFLRNFPRYRTFPKREWPMFMMAEYLSNNPSQKKVLKLEKRHHYWFDRWNKTQINVYKRILLNEGVDVVFNAHQRDVKGLPIIRAAKQINIPSVNFVYSWDNLPKGRMAAHTDYFCVWSERMKNEMNRYYPDVEDDRIAITGTPQFEFYHTLKASPREDFARRHGLDSEKRWILYSGDMTDASPYDQYYLQDVYNAWKSSPDFGETQLIFRRAPMDLTGRFDEILKISPEIVNIDPIWMAAGEHNNSAVVSMADVQMLVDLINHCETACNFGSTMAHDFTQKGKRVWYIDYEHPKIQGTHWSSEIFYAYTQFESMQGLDPVNWIKSREELYKPFQKVQDINADHISWYNRISADTTKASSKIVENLVQIVGN